VPTTHTAGLTMPRRQRTRAEDRAHRIQYERDLNQRESQTEGLPPWLPRRAV
jgi:hypothetical protein